jgi:hypothetical protein
MPILIYFLPSSTAEDLVPICLYSIFILHYIIGVLRLRVSYTLSPHLSPLLNINFCNN